MYLTGTQAKNLEATVKGVLKIFIISALEGEAYAATFVGFGGVDVLAPEDAPQGLGRPRIEFRKASSVVKPGWRGATIEGTPYPGTWHEWKLELMVLASGFTGAIEAESNPSASDTLLCDALTAILNSPENRDALDALGLENAKLEAGAESETDGEQENLFTLSLWTFSLPTAP